MKEITFAFLKGLFFIVWFCACWINCILDFCDYRERHAKEKRIVSFIKDIACADTISFSPGMWNS